MSVIQFIPHRKTTAVRQPRLFWVALLVFLSAGELHAVPRDEGIPPNDAGVPRRDRQTEGAAADAGASAGKALTGTAWIAARIERLRSLAAEAEDLAKQFVELKATDVQLPPQLDASIRKTSCDISDASKVRDCLPRRERRIHELAQRREESIARLRVMTPALQSSLDRLARLEKRSRRRKASPALVRLRQQAADDRLRLTLLQTERDYVGARITLATAQVSYLRRSQPARRVFTRELADRKRRERQEAEARARKEREHAQAEEERASVAKQAAIEEQRGAQNDAERLIAAERVRLQGIRGDLATRRKKLLDRAADVATLKREFEAFRAEVMARSSALAARLASAGEGAAAVRRQIDVLYDRLAKKWIEVRPDAANDLKQSLHEQVSSSKDLPPLSPAVVELGAAYSQVEGLEQLQAQLTETQADLDRTERALVLDRLAFLHQEVTWLNDRRVDAFAFASDEKRSQLTGPTRETVRQFNQEIRQLVFDGLYWTYQRIRKISDLPRLIFDVFTVGSLLWKLVRISVLLLLLRWALRRWNVWLSPIVEKLGRSITVPYAANAAKLTDAFRHAGPSLLVLVAAITIYYIVGGADSPTEVTVVYLFVFWIAVYRLQLRLVESAAKYTGMEAALRAAGGDEELFEELDSAVEGPPVPKAVRLAQRATSDGVPAVTRVVPASVLLVRSVRAATRYILVVVLILELTALAVGKGTIYGVVLKVSWLATLPFLFYFLRLWRPHIVRAYLTLSDHQQGTLARWVKQSERRFWGIGVVGLAFAVVAGNRLVEFSRRYLLSRDATKRLLAFVFRRRVAKHAQERGRVVEKRRDLPEDLTKYFPLGPLEKRDGPMPMPELDELKDVFETWQEARSDGSAVIVGRSGMGKTTIVRQLEEQLATPVLRADMKTKIVSPEKVVSWVSEVFGFESKAKSEKDLVRMIREDNRPVIAIDNCHNLFLRRVGGFDGYRAFVRIVNETCDNIFWLLTFNQAAWDYLNNVSGRVHYFRRVIRMKPWDEDRLRKLIMTRMRRARYRVSFSDLVVSTADQQQNVSAQIGRTSHGYFRLLWDYTGGNPQLACYFWLSSLVPDTRKRSFKVHLFSEPEIGELEQLPDDIAFVLTAVAEHHSITPDQAARATQLSRDFCRFAFRYCIENEYLARHAASGRYSLSLRWQQPIARYLKRRHLIYN